MEKGFGFEKENTQKNKTVTDGFVGGFFPVSTTKIAWKSRKRSGFFFSLLVFSDSETQRPSKILDFY